MTEKGTPFEIIGTTVCWIKETITVVFEPQESEEISERNMKMWEEIFKAEGRNE